MARGSKTIARDSVFGKSKAVEPRQGTVEEKAHQTAIWLFDAEARWLDESCWQIKSQSDWRGVTRSAFIRALVKAAMARDLDLEGVTGEEDLVQRLIP